MKNFNLISYENGRIVKSVKADTIQKAQNELEQKGYDCQNDYFLETEEETTEANSIITYRSSFTKNYQSEY